MAWLEEHPEIATLGDPEEWAKVREIVGQYMEMGEEADALEEGGREEEAEVLRQQRRDLWDANRELLDKYYPPTERTYQAGYRRAWGGGGGGGARWAPRRAPSYSSWEQFEESVNPKLAQLIRYYFQASKDRRKAYAQKNPRLKRWLAGVSARLISYLEYLYNQWWYKQWGGWQPRERYVQWRT